MGIIQRIINWAFPIERRSTLQNPASWVWELFGGAQTKAGISINQESALAHAALYACLKVLGETVASLPVGLYQTTEEGSKHLVQDARNTLVSAEPSELYHSADFRNTMMLHLGVHGNAYAMILRNGNRYPVELRILQPGAVQPFLTPEGQLYYRVTDIPLPVPARDIIHLKGLSFDGILGKSPIQVFRETIALGISAVNTQGSLWKNGTMMQGYLKHPGRLDIDAREKTRSAWQSGFAGQDNAGKTPLLDNGLEFIPLSLKPADALFIETAKLSRQDICAIYRVPPHMIGDLERSTNNNIEHQSLEFVRNTLLPYLKSWEQELNRKLVFPGEKGRLFFRFNVEGLLRGDTKSRSEYYTRALGSVSNPGWMTPNEVRALENMNRDSEGDLMYSPLLNKQNDPQGPDDGKFSDNEDEPTESSSRTAL